MGFLNAIRSFIVVFNYFCMAFTLLLNIIYIIQLFVSLVRVHKNYDKTFADDFHSYVDSDNLLPISLIIPAYNEQENIVQNIKSLLTINYPMFEIIVVNDGSTDKTGELVVNAFHMHKIETSIRYQIPTQKIEAVYFSKKYPNLLYVQKQNGGKSDALNAGIEFIKDSRTVVAGGLVRIANGSKIVNGELKGLTMPKRLIERFQIVEYYRSFLMGRVFWSASNSLLIVSGAFGLFRKQTVIDVGGYKRNTIGEDMEIVVRIHRYMRKHRKKYKVKFNEFSICWTQGPMSVKDIRSQRRRWQIGLMDTLISHAGMTFNPRYGMVGLFSVPYNWIFELFGAVVEVIGYFLIPFTLIMGELNMFFFVIYFLLSVALGVILSEGSLVLEQYTHRAAMSAKQSIAISIYAVLENFGYRQMITVFRVEGILKYRKLRKTWGKIKRKEFEQ